MRFIIVILALIKTSSAVQCNTNPCELDGDFAVPYYNCIQLSNNLNDVICTCPNGQGRINTRCRVCDTVNCGSNGVCIEKQGLFEGLFYACGCSNGAENFVYPGPCPNAILTTTTSIVPTSLPKTCLNGGIYNPAIGMCVCSTGFTGTLCETSIGQELCRNVACVNGGVCNPVPTANNGVEAQCWCLNGFSGSNCELIGTSGRCTTDLCQNNGVCEERKVGASLFAYCQCPPGVDGRRCDRRYFSCSHSGLFVDSITCKFGQYIQCVNTAAIMRSCPRGLRFNSTKMQCESDVSCPS